MLRESERKAERHFEVIKTPQTDLKHHSLIAAHVHMLINETQKSS